MVFRPASSAQKDDQRQQNTNHQTYICHCFNPFNKFIWAVKIPSLTGYLKIINKLKAKKNHLLNLKTIGKTKSCQEDGFPGAYSDFSNEKFDYSQTLCDWGTIFKGIRIKII